MTRATSLCRRALIVLIVALLATACSATPTITASQPAGSVVAGELIALEPIFDERIDFTLKRADINCSEQALTMVDDTTVWGAHLVVNGELGAICYGRTSQVLVDAWKVLVEVTPPEHLRKVAVFVGFSHNKNRGLRQVGVASSVGWPGMQISIDVEHAFADDDRLVRTLVHEMGHVLSLPRTQYDPSIPPEQCPTFSDGYGCFHWDSLMYKWVEDFWGNGMVDSVDWTRQPTPADGQFRCMSDEGFWNAYSATDPFEDFAEAYARYVLRQEPETAGQQARSDWFASRPGLAKTRVHAERWGHGPFVGGGARCA